MVETVIAAAIIAMMLGVTYQAVARAHAAVVEVQARREAVLVARSRLAEVGGPIPLVPGGVEGVSDGWRWRVSISAQQGEALGRGPSLDHVVVTVGDGTRILSRVETLRLAR